MEDLEKELQELVSDEKLNEVWGNANFGSVSKRDLIKNTLLKCACGWHTGRTAQVICTELGLLTKAYTLTKKGKYYLWYAYCQNQSL